MKKYIIALIFMFFISAVNAADTKLTDLTVLGSADCGDDELIYVIDDPNGTPVDRKIARFEFLLGWAGSANITTLGTIATGTWEGTAIADGYIPNSITIDLATLATTVTLGDDDATNDDHDIIFTTDAAGAVNLEADIGDFKYNPSTGTVTATEFSGGGAALTAIDAVTGDSATDFFDAGTIEHEWGGLQADVSAYTGLIAITGADTTAEIDSLDELEGQLADVTRIVTEAVMPVAAADPDVDAVGEIAVDTDGANETSDSSLRGYDGAAQILYAQKLKTMNFTLISPDTIDAADLIPVWHNTSGMTFTITEWKAWSDDDDVSLEIEELTDQTDYTAITTVDAVEIATNGTGVYYASDATITHAAIEHDHSLAIDFDTSDTPDYVQIAITGWFNSDVD